MKKEIDTWKIGQLIDVFNNALLWAWYLFSAVAAGCLWFFPIPQTNIQAFTFAGIFIVYTLLSVSITKVKQIKSELK